MKNTFNKIGLVVGLAVALTTSAFATLTTSAIGGNDSASLQMFGVTNTLSPATVYGSGATGYGGYVDVSQFDSVTLFLVTTNASAAPSTNTFTIKRALDNSGLTTETATYATFTVAIPATSYMVWQTNLLVADIAGQGYLTLGSLTNSSIAGTNGSGGYAAAGTTNNFPLQIGVMEKIKHALR